MAFGFSAYSTASLALMLLNGAVVVLNWTANHDVGEDYKSL
jgi:hypothetical protein